MEKIIKKADSTEAQGESVQKLKNDMSNGKLENGYTLDNESVSEIKFLMNSNEKLIKENSSLKAKTEMFKLVNNSFVDPDQGEASQGLRDKVSKLKGISEENTRELKAAAKSNMVLSTKLQNAKDALDAANDRISALNEKNTSLNANKAIIEKELRKVKNEKTQFESRLNSTDKDKIKNVQDIVQKFNTLTVKYGEIEKALEDKNTEIKELNFEIKKAQNLNEIQKKEFDASEYKKSLQVRENSKNLEESQKELGLKVKEVEGLKNEMAQKAQDRDSQGERVKAVEKELMEANFLTERYVKDIEVLEKKNTAVHEAIEALKIEKKKALEEQNEQFFKLKKEKELVEEAKKNIEHKLFSESEKLEAEIQKNSDLAKEFDGFRRRFDEVNNVNEDLKKQCFTLKESVSGFESKTSDLKDELDDHKSNGAIFKRESEDSIARLTSDLNRANNKCETIIKESSETEAKLVSELKTTSASLETKSTEYDQLKKSFSNLEEANQSLKTSKAELKKDMISLETTVKTYEEQLAKELKTIEEHEKNLKNLRADLYKQETDNKELIERHASTVKLKDDGYANLELEFEMSQRELQQSQERLEELQGENDTNIEKIEMFELDVEKLNNKLRAQGQDFEGEMKSLKGELSLKAEEIEEFSELRVEVDGLNQFLKSKEESLKLKEEDVYQREAKAKFFQKWFEQQKKIFRKKIMEFAHEIRISYNLSPLNDYIVVLDTEIQRTKKSMEYAGVGKKYSLLEKQLSGLVSQKKKIEEIVDKSKLEFNHRSKEFVNMLNDSDLLPTPPVPPKATGE